MSTMFRMLRYLLLALCGLLTPSLWAQVSGYPPSVLNPKTYVSPSGRYRLYVDPDDRYGRGGAAYRLSRQGAVVWEGARPFALWEASVTDDGTVGGYAYTDITPRQSANPMRDTEVFSIIILDPSGRARLDHRIKRIISIPPYPDARPISNPSAREVIANKASDSLIVHIQNDDRSKTDESWWVYRLSTGKAIRRYKSGEIRPSRGRASYLPPAPPPKVHFTAPVVQLALRGRSEMLPPRPNGQADRRLKERVLRLKRRFDRTWLGTRETWAVAPDGTLALVDSESRDEDEEPTWMYLNFYSAKDTPLSVVELPETFNPSSFGLTGDGKRFVLGTEGHFYCYGTNGKPLWQFTPPPGKGGEVPFLADGGRTLCLFDGERTVYRYAMP